MPHSGSTKGPKSTPPEVEVAAETGAEATGTDGAAPGAAGASRKGSASRRPVIVALDGVETPLEGKIVSLPLAELDATELARLAPDVVTCALFWDKFDAIHVINRLGQLEYTGKIVVIAEYLPNPSLVERELRALGPGPRLHLLSQDRKSGDLTH